MHLKLQCLLEWEHTSSLNPTQVFPHEEKAGACICACMEGCYSLLNLHCPVLKEQRSDHGIKGIAYINTF